MFDVNFSWMFEIEKCKKSSEITGIDLSGLHLPKWSCVQQDFWQLNDDDDEEEEKKRKKLELENFLPPSFVWTSNK